MTIGLNKCLALLFFAGACGALFAQVARVERASGDLRVRSGPSAPTPLAVGQTVNEGDDILTDKGTGFLRFTDGQTIAVSEGSVLKIAAYKFDANQAQNSVSSINLLRGAMRMLTGLIGTRNPASVRIIAGTATVGIRGTDFITALQAAASGGQTTAFTQVISGSVELSTAGGSLVAGAGQVASAVGVAAPAASSAAAMSGATLGQVGQLQSLNMAAGAAPGATTGAAPGTAGGAAPGAAGAAPGAAGAGAATGAAVGGISVGVIATGAAVLGAAAAISSTTPVTGTTGTTGTTTTTGTR